MPSKENKLTRGHEKPDVYRHSVDYVAWVFGKAAIVYGFEAIDFDPEETKSQADCTGRSFFAPVIFGDSETIDQPRKVLMTCFCMNDAPPHFPEASPQNPPDIIGLF